MKWNDKHYNNLNYFMRKEFGEKVIKLSLNGGFSCPNRDGSKGYGGCIFCSEMGSGEFSGDIRNSIKNQIESQKLLTKLKWPNAKYIAYFQSFSNTYGDIKHMEEVFFQALKQEDIIGIAIATRPDCINDEVLNLLDRINKITFLWVELGIQTFNSQSLIFLNTCYGVEDFNNSVEKLNLKNIKVVGHLILGIPGENRNDMLFSAKELSNLGIWGLKIHMLNILLNTQLYNIYTENKFEIMTLKEYIDIVIDILEIIRPDLVLHRLTGDGPKELLVQPRWILNKRAVLNSLSKELKKRETYQGRLYVD